MRGKQRRRATAPRGGRFARRRIDSMPPDLSALRSRAAWADPTHARHALLMAHPGHELRLYGWVRRIKPVVFILTDVSGAARRTERSRALLAGLGGQAGALFGRLPDQDAYQALLDGRHELFVELLDELSAELQSAGVTHLVVDAAEGYNSMHDVCRLLGEAAVQHGGRRIKLAEFNVVGPPDMGQGHDPWMVRLELGDDEFAAKLAAARGYPELASEVQDTVNRLGESAFRWE